MPAFNLSSCYKESWKSFSKWWIPLTVIAFFIVLFQVLPQILSWSEIASFKETLKASMKALLSDDKENLLEALDLIRVQSKALSVQLLKMGTIVFPLIALFSIILIMRANLAVKDQSKGDDSLGRVAFISLVHVLLAIVKLFAFILFIVPGVFLYVKLLFVSLIMIEEKMGTWEAIKKSWHMTEGNFMNLLLLVIINSSVQILTVPTIIGTIPATAFVNTARATAYQQLSEKNQKKIT